MCYHLSQIEGSSELQREFDRKIRHEELFEKAYHFNGFDKPYLPVISSSSPEFIDMYRWHLVPKYIKSESKFRGNTLNARSEEIFETASYRDYWGNRCLVICTAFFEPHEIPNIKKSQSWIIKPKESKFLTLGAIYSIWNNTPTFSIITTSANNLLERVHNHGKRMPLILEGDKAELWLQKDLTKNQVKSLMVPYPRESALESYRTIDDVFNSRINTNIPEALLPFGGSAGEQIPLF